MKEIAYKLMTKEQVLNIEDYVLGMERELPGHSLLRAGR